MEKYSFLYSKYITIKLEEIKTVYDLQDTRLLKLLNVLT